jgi:molybdopterin-containing oxidoreductase family membrane subunit
MVSSPYWHSALGPIFSIGSDLCSGIALVLAAGAFFCFSNAGEDRQSLTFLSRVVIGLLFLVIILEWSQISVSMWYARDETYEVLRSILFGPYWYVFWIVHFLAGMVIPLLMLIWKPANRIVAGYAGALAAVAYFSVHLNRVIPGQVTPAIKGLQTAYIDNRLRFEYFPSMNEWAVFAFAVGMVLGLYYLGIRLLPIVSTKSLSQGGN